MYKGKKILAIIPARGGSKGLPDKNIKPLLGKPLIGWTIEQAQNSGYIDDIFVSTDSESITRVAQSFGVSVPELRPSGLSLDASPSSEFIIYTIDLLKKQGKEFEYFILLEPTSPLRDVSDIDSSIEQLLNNPNVESLVGVSEVMDSHPDFLTKVENGILKPYKDSLQTLRRQELEKLYFFEGSVYLSKCDTFMKRKTFYHDNTMAYIVPKWKSYEVDDIIDFVIIESLMKLKLEGFLK